MFPQVLPLLVGWAGVTPAPLLPGSPLAGAEVDRSSLEADIDFSSVGLLYSL